jgi:hypothetical protein
MAGEQPSYDAGKRASLELILEHYRHLRDRFTHQGDRLWLRFYYFLTVEVALFGVFVKVQETRSLYGMRPLVLALGIAWTALWFLIAAQDFWFFEQSRKRLGDFTDSHIVSGIAPSWDNRKEYPTEGLKKIICFKLPKWGVTAFSVICPLLVGLMWSLLWLVR